MTSARTTADPLPDRLLVLLLKERRPCSADRLQAMAYLEPTPASWTEDRRERVVLAALRALAARGFVAPVPLGEWRLTATGDFVAAKVARRVQLRGERAARRSS